MLTGPVFDILSKFDGSKVIYAAANRMGARAARECITFKQTPYALAPFAPETAAIRAGRVMLQEMARHFSARENFASETTLSGRGYLHLIEQWQKAGYRVKLIFLQLASPEEAIARVAQRVEQGGHHIPEDVIRRRFAAGLTNFQHLYAPKVEPGCFTTMPAPNRYCWTGAISHEQTTDRTSARP